MLMKADGTCLPQTTTPISLHHRHLPFPVLIDVASILLHSLTNSGNGSLTLSQTQAQYIMFHHLGLCTALQVSLIFQSPAAAFLRLKCTSQTLLCVAQDSQLEDASTFKLQETKGASRSIKASKPMKILGYRSILQA
jgi:hypothetical protein